MQQLASLITNSFGAYKTEGKQDDGSVVYYLHDKPTLEESLSVWRMAGNVFSVSSDGGKTWSAGMDSSGNAVLNMLSVIGINAEWINVEDLYAFGATIGGWRISMPRKMQLASQATGKVRSNSVQFGMAEDQA